MIAPLYTRMTTLICGVAALLTAPLNARAEAEGSITPAAAAQMARTDVLGLIDRAHRKGKISMDERVFYRVAAFKAPHLLPDNWHNVIKYGLPATGCFTPIFVEAAQHLRRMNGGLKDGLNDLLLPPPDMPYTLDATDPYPVRVTYDDPSFDSVAQEILDAAIESFSVFVTQHGWWPPPIEPGADYYRIYIDDTGMGAGAYTSPYLRDTSSPYCVDFTYIVMDRSNMQMGMASTTAHEFSHACQAAIDSSETLAFWENTSTYAATVVYPDTWWWAVMRFTEFQERPHRRLEYWSQQDSYQYGGALWVYFQEYMYGNEDTVWTREVWEGSAQADCVNEPDYFDVIDAKLANQGGIAEAVKTLAHYRFFVGSDNDGQHFPDVDNWTNNWFDATVHKIESVTSADLPLTDQTPPEDERPQPNGCNYIVLRLNYDLAYPVRFVFAGQPDLLWNVDVLRARTGEQTTYETMVLDAENQGVLDMEGMGDDRLIMVVCQMAVEGYDPETTGWVDGDYTYSITYAAPAPTVTSIEPSVVATGSQDLPVRIYGSNFVSGPELTVSFSGDLVAAEVERVIGTEEIHARLVVGGTAELGPRDVIVTNPGGNSGVGPGLLTIVDPADMQDAGTGGGPKSKGCSCRAASSKPSGSVPALILLLMVAIGLARRRNT